MGIGQLIKKIGDSAIARLALRYLKDLRGVMYPRECTVCHRPLVDGEEIMCMHCSISMPRTGYHLVDSNEVTQRLAGGPYVQRAASWFHYKRNSPYVNLIHDSKYRGMSRLGSRLGACYSREILDSGFFDGIDFIIPVPMHRAKQMKRGYNQAEMIARGISEVTSIPIADNLIASQRHQSQTRRGAFDRYKNVRHLFEVVSPEELHYRHILLVDDVITTGSTIMACCEAIAAASPSSRVSVLTLASATLV